MARQPGYRQVSLTPDARDALRQMAYFMSGVIGQRVSLSDAMLIAKQMVFSMDTHIQQCAENAGMPVTPRVRPT